MLTHSLPVSNSLYIRPFVAFNGSDLKRRRHSSDLAVHFHKIGGFPREAKKPPKKQHKQTPKKLKSVYIFWSRNDSYFANVWELILNATSTAAETLFLCVQRNFFKIYFCLLSKLHL